ncbi:hypothetical protein Tsubulata_007966 [Turnera subulata]|uniref:SOSEKI DIX-like domain-containing protein n=1 Tax=Turnera subulata TaxID=218843 RepID=A0A9Q0G5F6_9ROSI|nr:hypothetical protein Tsubulata_007966 [Turnera subulata]
MEEAEAATAAAEAATRMAMGRGGGEVRRVHIIYFLSRMGRPEQPHLFRVHHHPHRNGVHLRDVKRWLGDLRGKDMPEAFAWSYKRRYRGGYVWQDLLDDDLITPISDNEYVLKGSEILVPSAHSGGTEEGNSYRPEKEDTTGAYQENEAFKPKRMGMDFNAEKERSSEQEYHHHHHHIPSSPTNHRSTEYNIPMKPSSEISEESEMSSTLTEEDSTTLINKHEEEGGGREESKWTHHQQCPAAEEEEDNVGNRHSSFYAFNNLLRKTSSKSSNRDSSDRESNKSYDINSEKMGGATPITSPSSSAFRKSKSHSGGTTSKLLRNLISCGAVDTNDAAIVGLKNKKHSYPPNINHPTNHHSSTTTTDICKPDPTRRAFGSSWNQPHPNHDRQSFEGVKGSKKENQHDQKGFSSQKPVSAANMPFGAPACSQCGKPFKPEKLHSHMKSCKGRKSFARTSSGAPPSEKPASATSTNLHDGDSTQAYFLSY